MDHNSDGNDDVIMLVATRKHSSDRHDDIIMPITIVFFLF
jgi:hypothetical protein